MFLDDGRGYLSLEKTSSVGSKPGQPTTPVVTATTVPPVPRRSTASVTTLDPSYDILEIAFMKLRNTPKKVRGNGVLDDDREHASSETTPSVGGAPDRTIKTPAVTATTVPPSVTTLESTSDDGPATTTTTTSVMDDDQDAELGKNMESSKDKPRTSFENSSNSVVTEDEDVELKRNNTKSSKDTTINSNNNVHTIMNATKNHTRVIRHQQQQQQRKMVVLPLLARKQKKQYHFNLYKKIKTRLFNLDEKKKKSNNTTDW